MTKSLSPGAAARREQADEIQRDVHAQQAHVRHAGKGPFAAPEQEARVFPGRGIGAALQGQDALHLEQQAPGEVVVREAAGLDAGAGIGGQHRLGDVHLLAGEVALQQDADPRRTEVGGIVVVLGAQGGEGEGEDQQEEEELFHGLGLTGRNGRRP